MIDFNPLWRTMEKKHVTTYQLLKDYDFSKGTLHSLKHNKNVTLHTVETLCEILQVPIEEIVRIDYEAKDKKESIDQKK